MKAEDKIKLFGMSHSLVERDLDKVEKNFKIALSHGVKKRNKNKTTTDYCGSQASFSLDRKRNSKGVWWMPWLKKAMKDAAWRRYASGRCQATFDPEMSE